MIKKTRNILKKHKSYDSSTGELHFDNFNIDFLRYFKVNNLVQAVVGCIIGFIVLIGVPGLFGNLVGLSINTLYIIAISGAVLWFIFTMTVGKRAVDSWREGARLAGRRGLFPFSIMMIFSIIALTLTGHIFLEMQFQLFLKQMMIAMIAEVIFTLPMDYGISYFLGLKKKKS